MLGVIAGDVIGSRFEWNPVGDSDTLGAITGGIAHAYYNRIPDDIVTQVREKLPQKFLTTIDQFEATFGVGRRDS
jgi:ADP-ribosylglycohydrolase